LLIKGEFIWGEEIFLQKIKKLRCIASQLEK
jgi:hypothetical protein